jgi:hypothetical protein
MGTLSQKIHCQRCLYDRAADDRPERDGEAADAAPAERPAPLGGHRGAEDGQRQRRDDRTADALERAGGVRSDRRRQRLRTGRP